MRAAGRAMFFASVLALLATSKPKGWSLAAAVTGPVTASAGRALQIDVDSSEAPHLRASGVAKSYMGAVGETPCLAQWSSGKKLSCLLPPGATLTSVDIEGSCGGCTSGCAPPPGAFVKVTTTDAGAWTDTTTAAMAATLPAHGAGSTIASRIEVIVSGATFVQVAVTVTPKAGGVPILKEEQACQLLGYGPSPRGSCSFLVYDSTVPPKTDVDVVVVATGWGACMFAAACAPPKTLRIDSMTAG